MPLANAPYRLRPAVELLSSKAITIEQAIGYLKKAVAVDEGPDLQLINTQSSVSYQQIPNILKSLENDWSGRKSDSRLSECFVLVHGRLEIHLHPFYLRDVGHGLKIAAGELLLRYSDELSCVPLGISKLKPTGQLGAIVNESPYVHFFADFQAVAFVPAEHQRLLGRATQVQTFKGLNLQVLGFMHFLIPTRDVPPVSYTFDANSSEWTTKTGQKVQDTEGPLCVTVTKANTSRDTVSLSGVLNWGPAAKAASDKDAVVKKKEGSW